MKGWDSGIQTPFAPAPYAWLILPRATGKRPVLSVDGRGKKGRVVHLGPVRVLPRWAQSSSFTWDQTHIWNRLSNLQYVNSVIFSQQQVSPSPPHLRFTLPLKLAWKKAPGYVHPLSLVPQSSLKPETIALRSIRLGNLQISFVFSYFLVWPYALCSVYTIQWTCLTTVIFKPQITT